MIAERKDMEQRHHKKEVAVYNGILAMLKSGKNMYSMTVSEIAEAAGMGKGTVYEYFSSKDEILAKSIVYLLGEMLDSLRAAMDAQDSFESKYLAVMDMLETDVSAMTGDLLQVINTQQLHLLMCDGKVAEGLQKTVRGMMEDLIETADKEGAVLAGNSMSYNMMAVTAAVLGYLQQLLQIKMPGGADGQDLGEIKRDSLTLLKKALR